jgi:hypothetical protein
MSRNAEAGATTQAEEPGETSAEGTETAGPGLDVHAATCTHADRGPHGSRRNSTGIKRRRQFVVSRFELKHAWVPYRTVPYRKCGAESGSRTDTDLQEAWRDECR